MATYRTLVMVCDNPSCSYREEHTKSEPATGYHFEGRNYWVLAGGGPIPSFYAHSNECILPALLARMKEDD